MPQNWCRCSPFSDYEEYRFLDDIGSTSWELENLCYFLGRAIPLIQTEDGTTTLLAVGGLFLLYHAEFDLVQNYFAVLNPNLSLEGIVLRLPEEFKYVEMEEAATVNEAIPDACTAIDVRHIPAMGMWEQRHGVDRWGRFRARGGKSRADCEWTHMKEGPLPPDRLDSQLRCVDDCPMCACFDVK